MSTDTTKPPVNGTENNTNENKGLATKMPSHSERFTNMVIREFSANAGGSLELTPFQKKLCQNYFIKIDLVLKAADAKRLAKRNNQEQLPVTWDNVNMQKLAQDVIIYSAVGLDPTQPNHINPIPYKNKTTNKYDLTFTLGYRGIELKAKKYAVDMPDDIVVELVYSTDKFRMIKKDFNNKIENYTFEVTNEFERGEIVGGFYYHKYFKNPEKNKLKVFSKKEIDKRKPDNASPEFWGGVKDKWVDGKKVGTEEVEGWYDEMAFKTIYRAAYNAFTIDSEKIDENYHALLLKESETRDLRISDEIAENGNKHPVLMSGNEKQETEDVDAVVTDAAPEAPEEGKTEQNSKTKNRGF